MAKYKEATFRALKLCLVTNHIDKSIGSFASLISKAARGGVTMVQLREKSDDLDKIRENALQLKSLLKPFKIPLIINDHVELAKEVNAEGVHIGQNDTSPERALEILGLNKIIGVSIESLEELKETNKVGGITYVTASAVFTSSTKPDCKTLWGVDGLRQVVELSKHPVTAIGGINNSNVDSIMAAGASGVAVVGAIQRAFDPYISSLVLRSKIDKATKLGVL